MVATLSDVDDSVRSEAASALGNLGDRSAVVALVAALSDVDDSVRSEAARALGNLGDRSAVDALVAALSDVDDSVRSEAARALGNLGDRSAVDALVAALDDENRGVRRSAASALGNLGDRSAVDALVGTLSDEDSFIRFCAAQALGQLGDRSAVDALVGTLSDDDDFVRQYAARALGELRDRSAVDALVAALSDDDDSVRSGAARALGKLNIKEAAPIVAALSVTPTGYSAQEYAKTLIHLHPAIAESQLHRYVDQFRFESWPSRMLGYMNQRLAKFDDAQAHYSNAVEQTENATNLLALGHFYLEQGSLADAGNYINQAFELNPISKLCRLSKAVSLWESGARKEGIEILGGMAKNREFDISKDTDWLKYDYFWESKAVSALEDMFASI